MSDYIVNAPGTTNYSYPEKLKKGDTLRFNVTNTNNATLYTGKMILYTVPNNMKIKIHAYGARGAYGNLYTYGVSAKSRSGNGAYVYGTFELVKGDKLLILVGQHGRDAMTKSGSTRDGVSGGGGGATTIAKKVASGNYKMVGHSNNGSTAYANWYVQPMIVAAGGNGSRDNGYSGTGTIYNGGTAITNSSQEALGNSTSTNLPGGTYSKQVNTNWGNNSRYRHGLSFLRGGLGSQYAYSRNSLTSSGGFGGGAANQDDREGGGGGGWKSGYKSAAAVSYVNPNIGVDYGSKAGVNSDHGYIIFEILEITSDYPVLNIATPDGNYVQSDKGYVYVNDELKFKRIKDLYILTESGWKKHTKKM